VLAAVVVVEVKYPLLPCFPIVRQTDQSFSLHPWVVQLVVHFPSPTSFTVMSPGCIFCLNHWHSHTDRCSTYQHRRSASQIELRREITTNALFQYVFHRNFNILSQDHPQGSWWLDSVAGNGQIDRHNRPSMGIRWSVKDCGPITCFDWIIVAGTKRPASHSGGASQWYIYRCSQRTTDRTQKPVQAKV
jgi:hypothetical protein